MSYNSTFRNENVRMNVKHASYIDEVFSMCVMYGQKRNFCSKLTVARVFFVMESDGK